MTMAISPLNGLVFFSAFAGAMNAARFDDFLTQARTNLDPKKFVIFVYHGVNLSYVQMFASWRS